MASISTLRAGIASALTDNSLYSVFSFPPATPIANSVIVAPADPYISPSNGWHASIAPMANFVISVMVPLLDNEGNLNGMEDNIVRVFNLLAASTYTYNVTEVSAPAVLSAASGDLLTCNITEHSQFRNDRVGVAAECYKAASGCTNFIGLEWRFGDTGMPEDW